MVHILTTCSALERRALFSKLYTISILGGITRVVAISRIFSTSTHTVKTDMEIAQKRSHARCHFSVKPFFGYFHIPSYENYVFLFFRVPVELF